MNTTIKVPMCASFHLQQNMSKSTPKKRERNGHLAYGGSPIPEDTARRDRNRSCAMAILAMPEHGQDARGTKSLHAAQNLAAIWRGKLAATTSNCTTGSRFGLTLFSGVG